MVGCEDACLDPSLKECPFGFPYQHSLFLLRIETDHSCIRVPAGISTVTVVKSYGIYAQIFDSSSAFLEGLRVYTTQNHGILEELPMFVQNRT
jgi:hypothetical protein